MKLKLILFTFSLAIFIGGISFSGCNKEESPGTEYIIAVDSIYHPDTITAGETLVVEYYGIVGISQCFSFYRFDVNIEGSTINTTAIGLYAESDCKEEEVLMNGEELKIFNLPQSEFTFIVNLPRNATMESKIFVKPEK